MQWQDKGQGFLRKNLSGESEYSSFIPSGGAKRENRQIAQRLLPKTRRA